MKHLLFIVAVIGFSAGIASAHANAERSEPKVGSEIAKPPADVKIWFSEEVEPAFSKIQVFGPDGKEIDRNDTHADARDKRLLIVSLPPNLGAGTYHVHWQVVSVDTHRTHNEFKFVVR